MSQRKAKEKRKADQVYTEGMSGRVLTESGVKVKKDNPPASFEEPPFDGSHFWVATSLFSIADPTESTLIFDTENLLMVMMGCYWCEKTYRPGMEKTSCPGDASPMPAR